MPMPGASPREAHRKAAMAALRMPQDAADNKTSQVGWTKLGSM
jgi:hypothetical protein